jgi:predicted ATPase
MRSFTASQGLCFSLKISSTRPEASIRQAIRIAQAQQARSLELRAACDLARLWGEQSRRTEARDLAAPVHSWFTEGFDTVDLKEAKALLDQLV